MTYDEVLVLTLGAIVLWILAVLGLGLALHARGLTRSHGRTHGRRRTDG